MPRHGRSAGRSFQLGPAGPWPVIVRRRLDKEGPRIKLHVR
jgi:hypothetical protein